MSSTLMWRPNASNKKSLSTDLKFLLRTRFELGQCSSVITLDEVSYLEGIRDASVIPGLKKETDKLIDAIREHGGIKVWLEY